MCLFCEIPKERIVNQNDLAYVIRDGFPVTNGHSLIIPKRHAVDYFSLTDVEVMACHELICAERELAITSDSTIDGFNIGLNAGEPGPHRKEQPFAKPHFNGFDPSGQYVIVPDKGLDKTFTFPFKNGMLDLEARQELKGREGSGPRHAAFHPSKPWIYIVNELDSTVSACGFNSETGCIQPFQITPSVSDSFIGDSRAAAIEINTSGTVLYVSNRGEHSISVFRVSHEDGRLSLLQTQPSLGKTPRFITLDPSGSWLYVLNEETDAIVVFKVESTGELTFSGLTYLCKSPVCMVF